MASRGRRILRPGHASRIYCRAGEIDVPTVFERGGEVVEPVRVTGVDLEKSEAGLR